jgi:pheromone shutdown-related protein TraB
MKNLRIIGTSHISKESVDEIAKAVLEEKPDIIAVELDVQRAAALFQKGKNKMSLAQVRSFGVKGYVFARIGQIAQRKLGKMVGMVPGSEMKTALEIARKEKINVALIDQPIQITLSRFSKALTWKERGRFLADFVKGIFSPRKQLRELGLETFDLRKVPKKEVVKKMTEQLKKRYPSIYRTLLDERNKYMVKKLVKLLRENPEKKILTIVGAGHVEGMEELLLKVDIIR